MPLNRKFQTADKKDSARKVKSASQEMRGKTAEQGVTKAFESWIAAVSSGNPEQVVKLYAEDAVLLPTLSPVVHDTPDKRHAYFTEFISRQNLKGVVDESRVRVFGEFAVNSGAYTFTFTRPDGKTQEVPARFSFVYRKEEDEWKIIEHHSSAAPAAGGLSRHLPGFTTQDNKTPREPAQVKKPGNKRGKLL
jgi:uncharacterized protein (TIGR02246 family)